MRGLVLREAFSDFHPPCCTQVWIPSCQQLRLFSHQHFWVPQVSGTQRDKTKQVTAVQCAGFRSKRHARYSGDSKGEENGRRWGTEEKGVGGALDRGPLLSSPNETRTRSSTLAIVPVPEVQVWSWRIRFHLHRMRARLAGALGVK